MHIRKPINEYVIRVNDFVEWLTQKKSYDLRTKNNIIIIKQMSSDWENAVACTMHSNLMRIVLGWKYPLRLVHKWMRRNSRVSWLLFESVISSSSKCECIWCVADDLIVDRFGWYGTNNIIKCHKYRVKVNFFFFDHFIASILHLNLKM